MDSYDIDKVSQLFERAVYNNNGCIETNLGVGGCSYPQIYIKGKHILATRYILSLLSKLEPTELALHRCNNPLCINILHLYKGTHRENIIDSVRAGTHFQTRKATCPRGHTYDRIYEQGKRRCSECARIAGRKYYNRKHNKCQ